MFVPCHGPNVSRDSFILSCPPSLYTFIFARKEILVHCVTFYQWDRNDFRINDKNVRPCFKKNLKLNSTQLTCTRLNVNLEVQFQNTARSQVFVTVFQVKNIASCLHRKWVNNSVDEYSIKVSVFLQTRTKNNNCYKRRRKSTRYYAFRTLLREEERVHGSLVSFVRSCRERDLIILLFSRNSERKKSYLRKWFSTVKLAKM